MLSDKEVINTGRQDEFDILKGLFIIAILLIHSFQVAGTETALNSTFYKLLFGMFMLTGAGMYLFTMGLGMAYSRNNSPKSMAVSGLKLIRNQFLCNLSYAAALILPLMLFLLFGKGTAAMQQKVDEGFLSYLFMLNIFFISGVIYLIMALLKKIGLPVWAYALLTLLVPLSVPFTKQLSSGNALLNTFFNICFGQDYYVSFCVYPYLAFTMSGYFFACYLRTVGNKDIFYKKVICITAPVFGAYSVWALATYRSIDEMFDYLVVQYRYPDLLKVIGTVSLILLMVGCIHFLEKYIKSENILQTIRFLAKHVSKYYAVHIVPTLLAYGFLGYGGLGVWGCILLFVPVWLVTDAFIHLFVRFRDSVGKGR